VVRALREYDAVWLTLMAWAIFVLLAALHANESSHGVFLLAVILVPPALSLLAVVGALR
jgi:hypothetical protein